MKISKTARINIIMIVFTLIITVITSISSKAAATEWSTLGHSKGAICFDNGTADTSDDIVFDATDFQKLYDLCK